MQFKAICLTLIGAGLQRQTQLFIIFILSNFQNCLEFCYPSFTTSKTLLEVNKFVKL